MRAGSLRDVAVFKESRMVKSPTGALRKEYIPVLRCRAEKKKFSNTTDKDKVEANEEFYGHSGVIKVRFNPKINDSQIMEFRGVNYKIILLDYQRADNSYLVNVNKMNK